MEAFRIVVFMAMIGLTFSTSISEDVFNAHGLTGRSLLQSTKSCTVDFENLNYTIITSRCKGPLYAAPLCCAAFKDFACPYFAEINDMTTNCAATMFSYINLYGKYPPGLFASECRDGAQGLQCTEEMTAKKNTDSSHAEPARNKLVSASLILLFSLLTFFFVIQ
ncbi:hypothetical protein LUZ60_000006 [Juncus effusus]|nr:hypothetical protein LUZ60_000006 [Juncus effusus]